MRRSGFCFRGFNLGLRVFLGKGWRSWVDDGHPSLIW